MKRQEKTFEPAHFSPSLLRRLQAAYRRLEQAVKGQPWLVQGSVNVVAPRSPGGNVTYTWTRKIRAKTATVALSKNQAHAFRAAIAANRSLEEALSHLREVSQTALLDSLPGVSRRHAERPRKQGATTVPKGA
jgi:hypothetical protein